MPALHPSAAAGKTPGRRGEKRPRIEERDKEDERRRKAGRIVRPNPTSRTDPPNNDDSEDGGRDNQSVDKEDDIFGKRGSSIAPSDKNEDNGESSTAAKGKRKIPSQQVLDNKAVSALSSIFEDSC